MPKSLSNSYYVIIEDLPESYTKSGFTKKSITSLIEKRSNTINEDFPTSNSIVEISSDTDNISLEVLGNSIYFNDFLLLTRKFFNNENTIYLNFNKTHPTQIICSGSINTNSQSKIIAPKTNSLPSTIIDYNSLTKLTNDLVDEIILEIDPIKIIYNKRNDLEFLKRQYDLEDHENPKIRSFYSLIYGSELLDKSKIIDGENYLEFALNYYRRGFFEEKENVSRDILFYNLGNLYLNQGSPKKIVDIIEENKLENEYRNILSIVYYHIGDYERSIPIMEDILNSFLTDLSNNDDSWSLFGEGYQFEDESIINLLMDYYLYHGQLEKIEKYLNKIEIVLSENESFESLEGVFNQKFVLYGLKSDQEKLSQTLEKYLKLEGTTSSFRENSKKNMPINWSYQVNLPNDYLSFDDNSDMDSYIGYRYTNRSRYFTNDLIDNSTFGIFYENSLSYLRKILKYNENDKTQKFLIINDLLKRKEGIYFVIESLQDSFSNKDFAECREIINLFEDYIENDQLEVPMSYYKIKDKVLLVEKSRKELEAIVNEFGYTSDIVSLYLYKIQLNELVENCNPRYNEEVISNHRILKDYAFNKRDYNGILDIPVSKSHILTYIIFNELSKYSYQFSFDNLTEQEIFDYEEILKISLQLDYENQDAFTLLEIIRNIRGISDIQNKPSDISTDVFEYDYHLNISNFFIKNRYFDEVIPHFQELKKLGKNNDEIKRSLLIFNIYVSSGNYELTNINSEIWRFYFPDGVNRDMLKEVLEDTISDTYWNTYMYSCDHDLYYESLKSMISTYTKYFEISNTEYKEMFIDLMNDEDYKSYPHTNQIRL